MPKAFASFNHSFIVHPEPGESDQASLEEVVNSDELDIGIIQEKPNMTISFTLEKSNLVNGSFVVTVVDGKISYEIDGVFEVNVRSNYINEFLDEDSRWQLNKLGGPYIGEISIDGLEPETYTYKRFGEEQQGTRYLINVVTSKSKKDLV